MLAPSLAGISHLALAPAAKRLSVPHRRRIGAQRNNTGASSCRSEHVHHLVPAT